ncbi:WecB/TagA/CpsF family glycosyltransferase [Clostridium sp. KNHs214]|uniref:WecB/TagA/CpsF family glycosyltransferase n=1 Tax=Clostridium sp. KNHs214 TaxID=1540257 RepID=UPI000555B2E4|nr:WecB/TagA/CpsF family glycosyltransferase [Clostridium sp. KNHs214]
MSDKFINLLGYNIFKNDINDLMKYINNFSKINIISGNPDILYSGLKKPELYNSFTSENSLIIPDGIGTVLASKMIKNPVKGKIAGIDLMKNILKECEKQNKRVYFLGASQENLDACVQNIRKELPKLNIVGCRNGYFNSEAEAEIVNDIISKEPYAIFIALGCPKQENFIIKYMNKIPATIFMGVGGSFDVIGEKTKRAPKWMIDLGLEWLYRTIKEPYRIKRLGSIPKFLLEVVKNK